MSSSMPSLLSRLGTAALFTLCLVASAQAGKPGTLAVTAPQAVPAITTIAGAPLTVRVGDDLSFQVFNADIPGVGQIYPSDSSDTADMGWIVHAGGVQFTPDFADHEGSATSNLGAATPYATRSVTPVTGTGTAADPFQVSVSVTLGSSGLRGTQVVRYVNGQNYFTKSLTLTNQGSSPQNATVFLGADIYLAGADSGVPYRDAGAGIVGGQDCGATPSYYILLIPQTPADAWSGASYSSIWSQIGAAALNNTLATGCIDNGAALQWNRTIAPGASVTIQAVTSFGDIPAVALFNINSVTPASGAQGQSVNVTITGLGFAPGTTFTFGSGITVTNVVIVDANTATATLTIADSAALGPRDVGGSNGTLNATLFNGFTVTGGAGPGGSVNAVPATGPLGTLIMLLALAIVGLVALRRH